MRIEVLVAMMGILVMGLTFLGGVMLISKGDEGLDQDSEAGTKAGSDASVVDASGGSTSHSVAT